jgi:diacylglycerol O-acyltransferase
MTPSESLMWTVERDPILRSTFLNLTILDGVPDMERLARRISDAIQGFPRMRQRVRTATAPWERHRWVEDASFDLKYHIRKLSLPAPGNMRALLDLAGLILEDAFDPVRPLWQLTVVDGLAEGRSAMLVKMHHTITDGVGGLRLSSSFLDLDGPGRVPVRPPRPEPSQPAPSRAPVSLDGVMSALGRGARIARPDLWVRQARAVAESAATVLRDGIGAGASPAWGARSMGRWLGCLDLDLDRAKGVAKRLEGTVNDYFVTGVVGGTAAYLRQSGTHVETLRVAMPVSTRVDSSFGGNSFVPTRVTVPAGIEEPAERFRRIHDALKVARSDSSLGMTDPVAALLGSLPPAVVTPLARQQVSSVDLAASNLRGSPVQMYVAGAAVRANYPMGPTAGVAFNCTILSYLSRLDMGIDVDVAAVSDPPLLRACIESSFKELDSTWH